MPHPSHLREQRSRSDQGPARRRSKEPVKREVLAVCAHYLGPARSSGSRALFRCPRCGKANFNVHPTRGLAGCLTADCPVPRATDSLGVIAHFEGLDEARDFSRVLEKGYEILALEGPRSPRTSSPAPRPATDPALLDRVYGRLIDLCPTDERARLFWKSRGVDDGTVELGRFGSMDPRRARFVLGDLMGGFSREELLSVPGFFERPGKQTIGFTLSAGSYALIPYHDRSGRITTVEGRFIGRGRPPMDARYLSLRGSGNHLYVFPAFSPDELLAFTEGALGAIVAARFGLAIGAIKGCRSYTSTDGTPLPELRGADLGGRTVPYLPDADDPPKEDVVREAPKAARALTAPHNGGPAIGRLPKGHDLDAWLLAQRDPKGAFLRLISTLLR